MKRSDFFILCVVIVGAPHLANWYALILALIWSGMAVYLISRGD